MANQVKMKIESGGESGFYKIDNLSVSQLKTIRDACLAYSKQGSSIAGVMAADIVEFMDNLVV
ncbi:MAG: hypothetical protein ABSG94_10635 [Brevinematales bacterium]